MEISEKLAQGLKALANEGLQGLLVVGQVKEAKAVPSGVSRQSGEHYDGYKMARVVTSLGESMTVKLSDDLDRLPEAGKRYAFFISRVWRTQSGIGAQAEAFI